MLFDLIVSLNSKGRLLRLVFRPLYAFFRRTVPSFREQHRLGILSGPDGKRSAIQAYHLSFLRDQGLMPWHSMMDIGCGPLTGAQIVAYLKPNRYVGIDIRPVAIAEAYRQLIKENLIAKNARLLVSHEFGANALNGMKFDFIWASQLLYHLDNQAVDQLFRHVARHMSDSSKFYGDIIGHPNNVTPKSSWQGFKFYLHTIQSLERIAAAHGLALKHVGRIEEYGYPTEFMLRTNDLIELKLINAEKGDNHHGT